MKLFDNLRTLRTLTPEMRLAMRNVRPADAKQNRLLVELQRQTEYLSKKDVGLWRAAWQQAINVQNPNRCALYDIYTDVAIDLHLTGCISQRKGFVLKSQYKLTDSAGKRDDRATEVIISEWFSDFINLVLDSRFYGHSLIQLGERISTPLGTPRFDNVLLVPRKHVIPEYGVIVRNCHDTPQSGVSYRTGDIAMQCVEAGKPDDLGLLLKCAPSALSKKNMLAFWDGFGEIFGMPIRIAKTTSNDEKYRSQIERMLARMGAAFYGVFQEGTEIEIKESSRGDAFNVYDKRIDKANAEISKGILNQTMTIDSGSSLSQSEVHLEVFKNIIEADRRFVADIVNDRLLPLMVRHGFKVDKLRFEWDDAEEYTPADIRSVEQMLVTGGYDIDPKYFVDKYGIPVTGRRQDAPTLAADTNFFV